MPRSRDTRPVGIVAFVALLCSCAFAAPIARAQRPLIAHDGRSDYVVVTATTATAPERRAADELRDYVERMTGARLELVDDGAPLPEHALIVGPSRAVKEIGVVLDPARLGDEGFVLKTVGARLVVAGTGRRGTLYGVETLLEQLGVRWFTPKVTRVPTLKELALPDLDAVELPDFEYREPYFTEVFERDFAVHNKLNGHSMPLDETRGGHITYRPFVHSFDELVPPALFATHPDYFPLIGGVRKSGYVQRCLTQPDVLRIAIERVKQWIGESPDARIFSVSQNDTYNFCECAQCKALTEKYGAHSGLYLWFVNQVADAIAPQWPDRLIDTLAYQFTEAPPTGIVPRRNVRVRLCPIGCCEAHPYASCSAAPNVAFLDHLRGWSRITDSLYVWHYNTNFAHYLLPFPDFAEFPAVTRLYQQCGVKGLFFQGDYASGGGGSDAELRSWVMAKLLWRADRDADALVSEWMQGVYGAAWKPMREWFDLLHAQVRAPDRHFFIYDSPAVAYLSPPVLDAGDKLFDAAEALARDDAIAAEYVAKARLGLRYARFMRHPELGPTFDAFLGDLRRFGVTQVSEGKSVDQFEQEWRRNAPPADRFVELDTLDLTAVEQDWGSAHARQSVEGRPLTIAGKKYEHGVGTHANSEIDVALSNALAFSADVGVDDEPCHGDGSVAFVVLVDGKEARRTGVIRKGEPAQHLEVGLQGAHALTLVVEDGGDGINYDHADWADAVIRVAPSTTALPHTVRDDDAPAAISLTTGADAGAAPHFNHPRITGTSPGKPMLFRIPASGKAPLAFAAPSLPAGLTLDAKSGVIAGSLRDAGRFDVQVTVKNELGQETRTLTIVGERDAIALTPPLGWNSWNCWALDVDDAKVRAAADAMVARGLAAHGFSYVNIDDGWEAGRDAQGRIVPNAKFPDMRALADYVHSKGLRLGIYSSPGPKTCGGFEGSWQHESQDAASYAEWGVDYLKYDWCSYGDLAPHPDRVGLQKPYAMMRDGLRASRRDVLFSLCQYGMGNVWEWGREVDGNCWRTTGDITDTWSSMAGIGFAQIAIADHSGPGHWNDPDMLVIGRVGWGPSLHPTRLSHNEQIAHITMWSMLCAPLLLGCDLSELDEFTLALVSNDDVLAISQDAFGHPPRRVSQSGLTEVWSRPLADGTLAVALMNRGRSAAPLTVSWKELGLAGAQAVRDCWMRRDEGGHAESYSVVVPRHGAALIRVGSIRD